MDISKKMEKIRSIVESPVIFKIGMTESGKYDLLSIDICQEKDSQMIETDNFDDYIG